MLLVEQGRQMFVRRPNGNSSVSSDPGERYIQVPEHNVSNSSSCDTSATSGLSSPSQLNVAAGGYPSVFPGLSGVTAVKESGDANGEPYILLEDCYSGQPVGTSSTLPVYSASGGKQALSSKQTHASVPIDMDAANHFGDLAARQKVEYCNEFELGEHDSVFVTVNSNCNYASGGCACADDDDDDVDDDVEYCHYKYPTIRYSIRHSMLSALNEPRSTVNGDFQEPAYVNCSQVTQLTRAGERELCPATKRYGICCESVLTSSELPKIVYGPSSSVGLLSEFSVDHYQVVPYRCRFYPSNDVTSTSELCNAVAVADAGDDDDDDDDDDDVHDYENVPHFHSHVQYCSPIHLLSGSATTTLPVYSVYHNSN